MDRPSFSTSQKLALAGGTLAIVTAVLPWLTLGDTTIPGYYDDGLLGVMAGGSIVGIVLIREWTMLEWLGVALFGGIAILFAGRTLLVFFDTGAVRVAVYLQIVAGLLAVAGGGYATVESRRGEAVDDDLLLDGPEG